MRGWEPADDALKESDSIHLFSRVVFALVGLMVGPLLGTTAAALLAVVLLRDSDGAPGDGIETIFLAMLGASLGAVLGLAAGLLVPIVYEQKQNRRWEKTIPVISDERV